MWLTIRSGSDMSSPYQRNDKNQNKIPISFSITDKNADFDFEALAKLRRDYSSNLMIRYLNISSISNKILQLTDICKTFPLETLCIDETKLDSSFPNAQVHLPHYQFPGRKIVYIRDGIIAKRLTVFEIQNTENIYV